MRKSGFSRLPRCAEVTGAQHVWDNNSENESMKRARWTKKAIKKVRSEITAELEKVEAKEGRGARLASISRNIRELQDDISSFGVLRCYTYICSGLIHHVRHGGLTAAEINRLSQLAQKLLMLQGIDPFNSPLSFLYGDVHNILGQIQRSEGTPEIAKIKINTPVSRLYYVESLGDCRGGCRKHLIRQKYMPLISYVFFCNQLKLGSSN